MIPVFADTNYFVALLDPRDDIHDLAIVASQIIGKRPVITSQMVLAEMLNHFSRRGADARHKAVQTLKGLERESRVKIVPQTPKLFEAALELYAQRPDKAWGLVDCASFCIMQEHGITEALAYDIHFQQAGYVPLLRENVGRA